MKAFVRCVLWEIKGCCPLNKVGSDIYNGYVGVGSACIHFWITRFYCRVDPKPTPPSLDNDLTII